MNGNRELVKSISAALNNEKFVAEVVIAPPAPLLPIARELFKNSVGVSAQNCSQEKSGAFTGEISVEMLKDLNIDWVILGHSERREIFKEAEELVADKVAFAVRNGLRVIACCGEKLQDRQSGKSMQVVINQLKPIAAKLNEQEWSKIVIAYEPVWAIGTGVVATPEQAQETHADIRSWISTNVSPQVANDVRIIYGGSVNAQNCGGLVEKPDIDGFLVGGASLKANDFVTICKSKL